MFTPSVHLYFSPIIEQMEYTLPLPSLEQWRNAVNHANLYLEEPLEGKRILVGMELIYMGKYRKDAIHHEYMIQRESNGTWQRMVSIYSERDGGAPLLWEKNILFLSVSSEQWKGVHCYPLLDS